MNLQHQQIIRTAQTMGIVVQDVSACFGKEVHILSKAGKQELILEGIPTSLIHLRAEYFCDNKQLAKIAFEACGISSPKSVIFTSLEDKALYDFWQEGKTYVAKPLDMTQGQGVVMHIKTLPTLAQYWNKYASLATYFMLEEQVEGDDLRIQVIGGKIVAACVREPAHVIGNGESTLAQLIEARQAVIKSQNPFNNLELDDVSFQLLAKQGLTLQSIPAKNQKVQLKTLANMAQGAIATDVTHQIHPDFHALIERLSEYLQASYFGIDFISTDNTKNPLAHTKALEVNIRPDWLHHTFSEGAQYDIACILLESIFPFANPQSI